MNGSQIKKNFSKQRRDNIIILSRMTIVVLITANVTSFAAALFAATEAHRRAVISETTSLQTRLKTRKDGGNAPFKARLALENRPRLIQGSQRNETV